MIFSVMPQSRSPSPRRRSTWRSFDRKISSPRLPLVFVAAFLLRYFGFGSGGRLGDAIESLAERPAGAKMFHEKIDRADAIFMVFVFSFLTPLALVAAFGLVAFVGAVLAGGPEAVDHRPGMRGWIPTLVGLPGLPGGPD